MYKLFLCLRYLLHRRIAVVPILAVMLCVAMDLIVTSVMGGFLDKVKTAARGLFGDVIISEHSLAGFGYYDTYTDAGGASDRDKAPRSTPIRNHALRVADQPLVIGEDGDQRAAEFMRASEEEHMGDGRVHTDVMPLKDHAECQADYDRQ